MYASEWPDAKIEKWIQLRQKYGFRMVFVINKNDQPENQVQLIERWITKRTHFDFLEMLNETYLPKYLTENTTFPEVTQAITPTDYVDSILPNFWAKLDQFNLPYYVCLARTNSQNPQQQTQIENWNNTVLTLLTENMQIGIYTLLFIYLP